MLKFAHLHTYQSTIQNLREDGLKKNKALYEVICALVKSGDADGKEPREVFPMRKEFKGMHKSTFRAYLRKIRSKLGKTLEAGGEK